MKNLKKIWQIKIGFTNYCNRGCSFCIIPKLDRNNISNKKIMSVDELYMIIDNVNNNLDLFEESISLALFDYNEPFADMELQYKYATILKENLNFKDIKIDTITNGDFLNGNFEEVYEKYLYIYDRIRINDYENNGITSVLDKIQSLSPNIEIVSMKRETRLNLECKYKDTKLRFYVDSANELVMKSRGGFLDEYSKKVEDVNNIVCNFIDGSELTIQWNGSAMACCETSNDIPLHKDLILGNIFHDDLQKIRENLKKIDTSIIPACGICKH